MRIDATGDDFGYFTKNAQYRQQLGTAVTIQFLSQYHHYTVFAESISSLYSACKVNIITIQWV